MTAKSRKAAAEVAMGLEMGKLGKIFRKRNSETSVSDWMMTWSLTT